MKLARSLWLLLAALVCIWPAAACADGSLLKVRTREGVATTLFWEPVRDARATVFLFPGGGGGFGSVEGGRPTSNNFLVRAAHYFTGQGFNVAIFGRPSDSQDLDYADRIREPHLTDVRKVLEHVKTLSSAPVWVVGTSRGTISATAMAIEAGTGIAGLVLTSSVVNFKKPGAVPTQDLAAIRVPTLVLHHAQDACIHCRPHEVPAILRGLKNAAVKKQLMVNGGANPTGDVCAGQHWHGFIGMEQEAAEIIAGWIRQPVQ